MDSGHRRHTGNRRNVHRRFCNRRARRDKVDSMKLRGRKPKLTFSEQVKLRTIQAAFGVNSPEVEQFWDAKRASMKATFERKRVYGKQSLDDRRASQRKSSLKYYHTHKDDKTPEAEARRAKHAEHSRNYYHRHKNDPEFIRRQRESTKRWKEKHKEAK